MVRQGSEPFSPLTAEEFDALAASPPVAEARFTCARHGTEAGTVRLLGGGERGWMVAVDSFVCAQRERIHAPQAEELRDALSRPDLPWIYALDPEWVPFYCAPCSRVYCGECWRTRLVFDPEWTDWVEETRGICPKGHERMLSD